MTAPANVYQPATPDPAAATRDALAVAQAGFLPIVEVFYSLQGEGMRTGQATIFVRFAGCNLACDFCDTDFRVAETHTVQSLLDRVVVEGGECRWVCLTGGEPTIHELGAFCDALHIAGFRIQLETNGTRPQPSWKIDHTTVSPKQPQGGKLHSWYLINANEFKIVVDGPDDLARAAHCAEASTTRVYLQPNALNADAVSACIDAVKQHPNDFQLSLQTHKFLSIR